MKCTKIILLLAVFSVSVACNKKLDVLPQNSITPDQITTADGVTALVFGAYSTLQNANAVGEKYNTVTELLFTDDELEYRGTFSQYIDFYNKQQNPENSVVYEVWANSYQTVLAVNLAISKLDLVAEEDRSAVEAEARFIRGLVYYELVNMFGRPYSAGSTASNPGVPLILEPIVGYDPKRDQRARNSVEEVYAQVIEDLDFAVQNLPAEADDSRANRYSALAILSRVYLSQGKYAEAGAAASEVIDSSGYQLTASVNAEFNNVTNSVEDIFAIRQTSQSNSGTSNFGMTTFYAAAPTGRGEIQVTEAFTGKFGPTDERGEFVYDGESISGAKGMFTSKWRDLYSTIPVVRLSEMYLTRAESNFETGMQVGDNTPLEDVNAVRDRAGAAPLTAISSVDDILAERLSELAFEGERFFTMKRRKLSVGSISFDDPILVLPIPRREIDLGNALPQNEGY